MALKCKFKDHDDMEDHMLDQMIWGCSSSEAQKTLIGKDEKLRLNHAVSIVRNCEATQQHMQSLNSMNNSSSVNAVSRYTRGRNPHKFQESHDFRGNSSRYTPMATSLPLLSSLALVLWDVDGILDLPPPFGVSSETSRPWAATPPRGCFFKLVGMSTRLTHLTGIWHWL